MQLDLKKKKKENGMSVATNIEKIKKKMLTLSNWRGLVNAEFSGTKEFKNFRIFSASLYSFTCFSH